MNIERLIAMSFALIGTGFAFSSQSDTQDSSASQSTVSEPSASQSKDDNVIIVTSDLRRRSAFELPSSVTVLDQQELEQAGIQHFQDVLGRVPNLNWSAGSSRPRYFQIRGIGERSQYEGAPNPSVGFVVDDIDFSGIGMIASLFDLQQVEVLRGPQGTQYGANALAGLISVRTQDPTLESEAYLTMNIGEDNLTSLGVVTSGALNTDQTLSYRLVVQDFSSDGFRNNAFLNRTDTNARDELTSRFKLKYQPNERYQLDLTLLHADFANGYDAFAIDNSFTTQSNNPGFDSQRSTALSIRQTFDGSDNYQLISITTAADSDILQSFDGDWGNDDFWGADGPYEFVSSNPRQRATFSQELRWVSKPDSRLFNDSTRWVAGLFYLNLDEDNETTSRGLLQDFIFTPTFIRAEFESENIAAFAQFDTELNDKLTLTSGVRFEQKQSDYQDFDFNNIQQLAVAPQDNMWGGQLSLTYQWRPEIAVYGKIARGYKAGGFNVSAFLPDNLREYQPEFLTNYEIGANSLWIDNWIRFSAALFVSKRTDQQISTSEQLIAGDPNSFIFFTDNAAEGTNQGFELEVDMRISDNLGGFINLGLLDTQFDQYDNQAGNLEGRDQAHAPSYNYSIGLNYADLEGWFGVFEVTGSDEFFFSDSHDQISQPFNLVHTRFGFQAEQWQWSIWGRNILDTQFATRGFFFGNEPPDFPDRLYTQLGDPAQWGMTFQLRFE